MTAAQPEESPEQAAEAVTATDIEADAVAATDVEAPGVAEADVDVSAQADDLAAELEKVRAELTADMQRIQAEYANYRRRTANDKREGFDAGKAALIGELLPILDDLDRARAHGDLESGPLKAVADKITGVFVSQGVVSFGSEGETFDPALHEAVQHEGDGSNPVIGAVYRQGYRLGEKVLRTAMVTVTDAVEPPAEPAEAVPEGAVTDK